MLVKFSVNFGEYLAPISKRDVNSEGFFLCFVKRKIERIRYDPKIDENSDTAQITNIFSTYTCVGRKLHANVYQRKHSAFSSIFTTSLKFKSSSKIYGGRFLVHSGGSVHKLSGRRDFEKKKKIIRLPLFEVCSQHVQFYF